MRTSLPLTVAIVAALALAGCSSDTDTEPGGSSTADTGQNARNVSTSATFAAGGGAAVTYDEELVPAGAGATVTSQEADGSTTVTLEVTGLLPDRAYGAHAHVNGCGAAGSDAGPHYQLDQDPVSPSVDPAFANPSNEIWLDLTTDAEGTGTATATVDWVAPADRRPESVIIHEMQTATGPGEAGTAGDRPACITVDF